MSSSPYSALAVANTFLDMAEAEGRRLTQIEVQKLVYFAHGWHLAITGKPLISETVEAWPYGPVVESLYHAFKEFKGQKIDKRAKESKFDMGKVIPVVASLPSDLDDQTARILKTVWDKYKNLSGGQFISLTHRPNTPWSVIAEKFNGSPRDIPLDNEAIKQHFVTLAESTVRVPA